MTTVRAWFAERDGGGRFGRDDEGARVVRRALGPSCSEGALSVTVFGGFSYSCTSIVGAWFAERVTALCRGACVACGWEHGAG